MKIELLYQSVVVTETSHRPERIDEFQARVNDFIADKKVIDITYSGNGGIEVEYASDEDLTESFERITNSFNHTQVANNFDDDYISQRMFQLQNMDKQDMAELLAKYELELINHADRLLSDDPLEFDSMHGYETIELLGHEVINLVKHLDIHNEFDGIHDYVINQ